MGIDPEAVERGSTARAIVIAAALCAVVLGSAWEPSTVRGATATMTATTATPTTGTPLDDMAFSAQVTPVPTGGSVEWAVDGTVVATAPVDVSGVSAWTDKLAVGTHDVVASFTGDGDFDPSSSEAVQVVIDLVATTTSLTVTPDPVDAGSPATFDAEVSAAQGSVAGHVEWRVDGDIVDTTELGDDGTASTQYTWPDPGDHSVRADFVDGTTWANSHSDAATVTVAPVPLSITATPVDPITLVGTSSLHVAVAPTPAIGTVKVLVGEDVVATVTVPADGKAEPDVPVVDGTNSYRVDFIPDGATYVAASTTAVIEGRETKPVLNLTADRASVISSATRVTFTVMPDPWDIGGTGTTTLHDTFGGTTTLLGTATASTDSDGNFIWVLSTRLTGVGTHHVHAAFTGNELFASSESDPVTITVTGDTSVSATGVGISYATFYPYTDSYRDSLAIRGTPGEPVSVSVSVYNGAGKRVRSWSVAKRETPWTVTWNGRTSSGARVPDGRYKVVQTVRDVPGHSKAFSAFVSVSSKRLYWYAASQTKYADAGTFGWTEQYGSSVEYSYEIGAHGIFMYGGGCDYNPETDQTDLCGVASGRYRFTLPAAAVYSSLTFSVYGFSWENMGMGHMGIENYDTGFLDNVRDIGYTFGWRSTSPAAQAGHVSSSRIVSGWVWVQADPYPEGSLEYQKVKLSYKYGVLR